jgi:exodeoxyribonuclease V alpha subunit
MVERVTYSNPENGFAVLKVRPRRGALFTATGYVKELASDAGLVGAEFLFRGNWEMTKYGRQFAFSECRLAGSELLFFLSKVVKGLGEALARRLLDKYGEEELVRILDEEPERLLSEKGIKEKRLAMIKRSWHKHRSLKSLSEYLGSHGQITPNLLIRIYNHFEDRALEIIKENPYRLTEVRGIGFKTADRIAMNLGLRFDSPWRIKAAIDYLLVEAAESDGHCWLPEDQLYQQVEELLSTDEDRLPRQKIRNTLLKMILEGEIVTGDGGEIGLSSYRYMEEQLREFFLERAKSGGRKTIQQDVVERFIRSYQARNGVEFAPEQRQIIEKIALEPRLVFGLAGYAGTGKTTVCRAILELLSEHYAEREQIICCAFTGMASARLRKTTGFDAVTIHSLLKYKGDGSFEHGPDNPLPHRVVVLDEASMVNLTLFYRLARALRPSALMLLVGDPAQLPPIGAGNVFADALETGLLPAVHLERIFRQSEGSVLTLFANEIRQGRVPEGVEKRGWEDFRFEQVQPHNIYALKKGRTERELKRFREVNNQAILERILELAASYRRSLQYPAWEFQVLTPMRMGQLGTEILNQRLQEILNPQHSGQGGKVTRAGITLREGDKVVHLQNRDMEIMDWASYIKEGRRFRGGEFRRIFNGYVGLVQAIDHEAEQFHVVYPERIVVAYDFDLLGDVIELAYALTVHKAQGSQYRIVVIPLTNSHFIMLNNKWFYTAITRAEEMVYLIGQPYALKRACTNVESVERFTWLRRLDADWK